MYSMEFLFYSHIFSFNLYLPQASRHGDLSRHELSQHSVHGLADRSRHSNYADRSRHSGNADRSRRASGGVLSIDRNGNSDADNTIHSITLQVISTSVHRRRSPKMTK